MMEESGGLLAGRSAIITGAGRGIGRAIAVAFASQGCNVALCSRTQSEIVETARLCESYGVDVLPMGVDITDWDAVQKMELVVRERFIHIDILVNNAGYAKFDKFLEQKHETWMRTIEVNLTGTWQVCKAIARQMVKQGEGRIINIASVAGHKPIEEQSAYCAAKHGLIGLSKCLALELREHNIAVNAISPGAVETQMSVKAMGGRADRSDWMQPEDVAHAALYLASLSPRAAVDDIVLRLFQSTPLGG